ncbi:MAG: sodium:calcium antiporter [Candidatus Woesearchaeota archaeon]
MIELIILIIGLVGLWIGSELAINGAKNIANHFRISSGFFGLTILSIGTSVPEIAVSIAGGIERISGIETSGIVIGNIVGSAANLLTILLGAIGLFGALWISPKRLLRDGLMLIGSVILLAVLSLNGQFSIIDGYLLIAIYFIYLADLAREEKLYSKVTGRKPQLHLALDLLRLVGGLLLVVFASDHVVRNGIELANAWGVTQAFVGVFVVGLGTGLPELAISISALRKKQVQMSIGNLIGSNICDLLFALGAGAVISGFVVSQQVIFYDLPALLIIASTVLFFFRRGYKLTKSESTILILMYITYIGIRFWLFG